MSVHGEIKAERAAKVCDLATARERLNAALELARNLYGPDHRNYPEEVADRIEELYQAAWMEEHPDAPRPTK